MLYQDKIFVLFIFLFTLFSCKENSDNQEKILQQKYDTMKHLSIKISTQEVYQKVYNQANDSIKTWVDNSLSSYLYEKGNIWQIDSLLCFSSSGDKCIMALLNKDKYPTSINDGIFYFYGVKMKNTWYFFKGSFLVLFRAGYQQDIHTPLSFPKLHEIAIQELFIGYLKKDEKGEYQINQKFFEGMENSNAPTTTGYGSCFSCKTFDEYVLYLVKRNWQQRDTTR